MSIQTKLIKDILSTYDTILENKKISEATDVYDNVDFKDYVVGTSTPSKDTINLTLLQDINKAARSAGIKVDITTAVSGHKTAHSRHPSGNAVDISKINGKAVSSSNREDADKLVDELVKMGYVKNKETGNPKAVLTFGFPGHDNHVHVSNTTSSGEKSNDTTDDISDETSIEGDDDSLGFAGQIGKSLLGAVGINEGKVYSSFGKNYSVKFGEVVIPKENNEKIKSPVSGKVVSFTYNSSCDNQLVIKFEINGDNFYLEYCGLKSHSVKKGSKVSKGDLLGKTDSDVKVVLYNSSGNKKYIKIDSESHDTKTSNGNDTNKYNQNDGIFTSTYKTVRDTWFKKDKLKENIGRIKGLL
jgi:murein DD-endopeptidase MepM/ murein hydrolase activator NlpD